MLACVDFGCGAIIVHVDFTMCFGLPTNFLGNLLERDNAVDLGVQVPNPVNYLVEIKFVIFVEDVLNTLVQLICGAFFLHQPRLLDGELVMSQLLAVVLLLADVSGHGLDNIVEQKVAELVEGGYLQPRDKSSSKSVIFYHQLSVGDEVALSAAEGNNKILKFGRFNVANRVMVELLPYFPELVNIQLRNGQTERVRLA
jgi:hypothetical protein